MDGFTPGWGGDCCCEMEGCGCDSCAMGGARESCAAWRKHYYWNHTSDDKKQFFVVASGDFRHNLHEAKCLETVKLVTLTNVYLPDLQQRIPPEIGSHLRDMIPESDLVKLEAPSGCVYPVEVSRELGIIVLRSGWNKFVNAHHIEEDNSILFVYRGNSCFKVNVLNLAGHEKSFPCPPPPSGISEPVTPFAPSHHHVKNEQVVPNPGHVNSTNSGYVMLPGCCLTIAQGDKVQEIAHATRSEIPLYVAVMSKSNVSLKNCYVYIPLRFVDNFREGITKDAVELQGPCNIVCVGVTKHRHDQIVLKSGWNKFVDSHHVQESDLLIFRRMEKPRRLEVCIFDPSGREKISSCSVMGKHSSSAEEMCDDSVQIVDPPQPQIIDLRSYDDDDIVSEGTKESCRLQIRVTQSSDDDDIVSEGTKESCRPQKRVTRRCAKARKMGSTSSPSTKSGYGARKPHHRATKKLEVGSEPLSSNLRGLFQRPYILALQTTLPMQVQRKVENKVQAIGSELPIFVKQMTTTNIDGTDKSSGEMMFGMVYASACLPDETQPLLLQLEGRNKQWHATLSVTSRNRRRVFTGWKGFVGDNQLKAVDICLFEVSSRNSTSLTMTVHLVR